MKEFLHRFMLGVHTCIPGRIDAFFPATQTVKVTPAIKSRYFDENGKQSYIEMPTIDNVPIVFPYSVGAKFAMTMPVKKGDPCLIFFAERAIDNWHDLGGVQPPELDGVCSRHHDLTDAFVILAPSPLPNAVAGWEENGIELRSTAPEKSIKITITDSKIEIVHTTSKFTVTASGVEIDAPVIFKKAVEFKSTFKNVLGVDIGAHSHAYTDDGNPMVTGIPQ
jgi:hypothetical protein